MSEGASSLQSSSSTSGSPLQQPLPQPGAVPPRGPLVQAGYAPYGYYPPPAAGYPPGAYGYPPPHAMPRVAYAPMQPPAAGHRMAPVRTYRAQAAVPPYSGPPPTAVSRMAQSRMDAMQLRALIASSKEHQQCIQFLKKAHFDSADESRRRHILEKVRHSLEAKYTVAEMKRRLAILRQCAQYIHFRTSAAGCKPVPVSRAPLKGDTHVTEELDQFGDFEVGGVKVEDTVDLLDVSQPMATSSVKPKSESQQMDTSVKRDTADLLGPLESVKPVEVSSAAVISQTKTNGAKSHSSSEAVEVPMFLFGDDTVAIAAKKETTLSEDTTKSGMEKIGAMTLKKPMADGMFDILDEIDDGAKAHLTSESMAVDSAAAVVASVLCSSEVSSPTPASISTSDDWIEGFAKKADINDFMDAAFSGRSLKKVMDPSTAKHMKDMEQKHTSHSIRHSADGSEETEGGVALRGHMPAKAKEIPKELDDLINEKFGEEFDEFTEGNVEETDGDVFDTNMDTATDELEFDFGPEDDVVLAVDSATAVVAMADAMGADDAVDDTWIDFADANDAENAEFSFDEDDAVVEVIRTQDTATTVTPLTMSVSVTLEDEVTFDFDDETIVKTETTQTKEKLEGKKKHKKKKKKKKRKGKMEGKLAADSSTPMKGTPTGGGGADDEWMGFENSVSRKSASFASAVESSGMFGFGSAKRKKEESIDETTAAGNGNGGIERDESGSQKWGGFAFSADSSHSPSTRTRKGHLTETITPQKKKQEFDGDTVVVTVGVDVEETEEWGDDVFHSAEDGDDDDFEFDTSPAAHSTAIASGKAEMKAESGSGVVVSGIAEGSQLRALSEASSERPTTPTPSHSKSGSGSGLGSEGPSRAQSQATFRSDVLSAFEFPTCNSSEVTDSQLVKATAIGKVMSFSALELKSSVASACGSHRGDDELSVTTSALSDARSPAAAKKTLAHSASFDYSLEITDAIESEQFDKALLIFQKQRISIGSKLKKSRLKHLMLKVADIESSDESEADDGGDANDSSEATPQKEVWKEIVEVKQQCSDLKKEAKAIGRVLREMQLSAVRRTYAQMLRSATQSEVRSQFVALFPKSFAQIVLASSSRDFDSLQSSLPIAAESQKRAEFFVDSLRLDRSPMAEHWQTSRQFVHWALAETTNGSKTLGSIAQTMDSSVTLSETKRRKLCSYIEGALEIESHCDAISNLISCFCESTRRSEEVTNTSQKLSAIGEAMVSLKDSAKIVAKLSDESCRKALQSSLLKEASSTQLPVFSKLSDALLHVC